MSIVKKLPKTETGHGVECTTESGNVYVISNDPVKKKFTLWKTVSGGYEKMGTSDSPINLYKKCI